MTTPMIATLIITNFIFSKTTIGSITSRCSGKWAHTHPPGRIKDRTRETTEIEPKTTMVAIFPHLCLWRRSLTPNLGGIDAEKLYIEPPYANGFTFSLPSVQLPSMHSKLSYSRVERVGIQHLRNGYCVQQFFAIVYWLKALNLIYK